MRPCSGGGECLARTLGVGGAQSCFVSSIEGHLHVNDVRLQLSIGLLHGVAEGSCSKCFPPPDRDIGEQVMQWDMRSCADAGYYVLVEAAVDFIVHSCCSVACF
nr:unnamed protein product [Digitaria exilis]